MRTDGQFILLDREGLIPSPGGGALLLHDEESPNCYLVLFVSGPADQSGRPALITFVDCAQSLFGYPNDEAAAADPRLGKDLEYGFYEVRGSSWADELDAYNRRAFPASTLHRAARHFFIGSKEASAEFLAADLQVEVFDTSYGSVVQEALRRLNVPLG